MKLMGESCDSNCHQIMEYIDKHGPLEDYDLSEDNLAETDMSTLRILLQVLKNQGASGLELHMMKKIYKEEKLKYKPKIISFHLTITNKDFLSLWEIKRILEGDDGQQNM